MSDKNPDSPNTSSGDADEEFMKRVLQKQALDAAEAINNKEQESENQPKNLTEDKKATIEQLLDEVGMTVEELALVLGVGSVEKTADGISVQPSGDDGESVTLEEYLRENPDKIELLEQLLLQKAGGYRKGMIFQLLAEKNKTLDQEQLAAKNTQNTLSEQLTYNAEQKISTLGNIVATAINVVSSFFQKNKSDGDSALFRRKSSEDGDGKNREQKGEQNTKDIAKETEIKLQDIDRNIADDLVVLDVIHDKERYSKAMESQQKSQENGQGKAQKIGLIAKVKGMFSAASNSDDLGDDGSVNNKDTADEGGSETGQEHDLRADDESQVGESQLDIDLQIKKGSHKNVQSVILADIIGDKHHLLESLEAQLKSGNGAKILSELQKINPSIKSLAFNDKGEVVVGMDGSGNPQKLASTIEGAVEGDSKQKSTIKHNKLGKGEEAHAQGIEGDSDGDAIHGEEVAVLMEGEESLTEEQAIEVEHEIHKETKSLDEKLRKLDAMHDKQAELEDTESYHQQQHMINAARQVNAGNPMEAILNNTDFNLKQLQEAVNKEINAPKVTPGKDISPDSGVKKDIANAEDIAKNPNSPEKSR